jgi:hypothetical protein
VPLVPSYRVSLTLASRHGKADDPSVLDAETSGEWILGGDVAHAPDRQDDDHRGYGKGEEDHADDHG